MKKGLVLILALMLMVGVASAQVELGVGGGISKLTGDGNEMFKLGFNGRVTAFKSMGENLQVGVMGAYNMFSVDEDEFVGMMAGMGADLSGIDYDFSGSVSVIEILPSVRYFMSPQFFLQAGGGLYMNKTSMEFEANINGMPYEMKEDESESNVGVSLGAGFNMGNIGIAAFYNIIFTEDESTKYFTVNAMIGL